jgi:H+-transporting ATPase
MKTSADQPTAPASKPEAKPGAKSDPKDELKTLPLPEVGEKLESSPEGLTQAEAQKRLAQYGPNELVEKKTNLFLKFLGYFWGPIPWMIEVAVILSGVIQHWPDFFIILLLLVANAVVGFWEEREAGNAIAALKAKLAIKARVKRDGKWINPPARELVPGDVIRVRLGDIVPADARLLDGDPVEVDQSALTGESSANPVMQCFPVQSSVRARSAQWFTPRARKRISARRRRWCRGRTPPVIFKKRF